MTARFAIYAAPGTGSADSASLLLREKAEQWLGRSISGAPVARATPAGWTREEIGRASCRERVWR